MSKQNKYTYLYVVQGDYGSGFEDLTASESRPEARRDLRDYVKNDTSAHALRIIQRRELNENEL